MNGIHLKLRTTIIGLLAFLIAPAAFGQSQGQSTIDLQKARLTIDSLDKQFSRYYFEGDSVSLYNMYAKGATVGSIKGEEILSFWGKQIRNAFKNDTRHFIFTTTSLSTDGEFLAELGTFKIKDSKDDVKATGKYLVVWKMEDGTWKLYRDMSL